MSVGTEWVAPGLGASVAELVELARYSSALGSAEVMQAGLRLPPEDVTSLAISDRGRAGETEDYDMVRIAAALDRVREGW